MRRFGMRRRKFVELLVKDLGERLGETLILDHNPTYGGCTIEKQEKDSSGVSSLFRNNRVSLAEMERTLRAIDKVLNLKKNHYYFAKSSKRYKIFGML